jgi:chromosome segregation ATPase
MLCTCFGHDSQVEGLLEEMRQQHEEAARAARAAAEADAAARATITGLEERLRAMEGELAASNQEVDRWVVGRTPVPGLCVTLNTSAGCKA